MDNHFPTPPGYFIPDPRLRPAPPPYPGPHPIPYGIPGHSMPFPGNSQQPYDFGNRQMYESVLNLNFNISPRGDHLDGRHSMSPQGFHFTQQDFHFMQDYAMDQHNTKTKEPGQHHQAIKQELLHNPKANEQEGRPPTRSMPMDQPKYEAISPPLPSAVPMIKQDPTIHHRPHVPEYPSFCRNGPPSQMPFAGIVHGPRDSVNPYYGCGPPSQIPYVGPRPQMPDQLPFYENGYQSHLDRNIRPTSLPIPNLSGPGFNSRFSPAPYPNMAGFVPPSFHMPPNINPFHHPRGPCPPQMDNFSPPGARGYQGQAQESTNVNEPLSVNIPQDMVRKIPMSVSSEDTWTAEESSSTSSMSGGRTKMEIHPGRKMVLLFN